VELQLPSSPEHPEKGELVKWKVPTRAECMSCHSRQANFVLGLSEPQADSNQKYGGGEMNQLLALEQQKVIKPVDPPSTQKPPGLVNPYDKSRDLEARVRSYLHANCSSCHVEAGGGNSRIRLNIEPKREDMQLVDVFPQHETFGLPAAMLVASGEPQRSVLYQRISRRGPGQMPPRGTQLVDQDAVQLVHDWIAQLPPKRKFVKDYAVRDIAPSLGQLGHGRSYEAGARLFKELGCVQCHRFAGAGGGAGPDLTGVAKKRTPQELLESIVDPSKQIAPEFASTIIVTSDGKTIEGRIAQEDDKEVIIHSAGALGAPVTVRKDEIEDRKLSATSTMPTRLLNTLEMSEILDLLAYLMSEANPKHAMYSQR
jgi:putative heme-binding domain-containing protein